MKRMISAPLVVMLTIWLAYGQARPAVNALSAAVAKADANSYVIGPQDVLQVNVWKEPEMSAPAVPVRPDGQISLPLLGDVQAAGLTPTELGAILTAKTQKYVQDAQVTIVVTAVNSKRVYLLGEIQRPGPVAIVPDMHVLEALSTAGGLTRYANAKKIYLLRSSNGKQERVPFNYKAALKGEAQHNLSLQPGDTIVVP